MQGGDLELLGPIARERTSVAPANPAVNKAGVEGAGADRRARGLSFRAMLKPLALLTVLFSLLPRRPRGRRRSSPARAWPARSSASASRRSWPRSASRTRRSARPSRRASSSRPTRTTSWRSRSASSTARASASWPGEFFTAAGKERTAEGVGKRTLAPDRCKKKLKHVKCETFRQGKRKIRSCHIGRFDAGQARHRVPDRLEVASQHDQRAGRQRLGPDEGRALALARLAGVAALGRWSLTRPIACMNA